MWSPAFKLDAVPCPCAKYRNNLPDRCFSSGHVAAGLEEFEAMVPGCGSITSASAASTFFPGCAHWMTKSRALFDQWLKRHRLPTALHPMFQKFCEEQWLQHVNMLEQTPRLNWAMLQKVKSTLHKDLVLYSGDHHPNHIVCFCPRFFLRGLCNTWDDPSVFRSLDGSPENWRQKMLDEIPAHLSRRYSWSFCKSASLPRGTVFLKRKKQFAKCSKLLEMASVALTVIAKTLHSDSPGMQSMPQLWKSLHRHWARPSEEHDVEWNDELVGFFMQCPAGHPAIGTHHCSRISAAYRLLSSLDRFVVQDRTPGEGQRPASSAAGVMTSQPSFSTGVFTAAGKRRLQVEEGTCVGNQISPIESIL